MKTPSHPVSRRAAVLLAFAIGIASPWSPLATAAEPVMGSEQLDITGAVVKPLTLKVEDLKGYPAEQISTFSVTRRVDDKDVPSVLKGVRLTALLDKAALAGADKNTWKHAFVLATATDGYQVVFSWPELFNTEVGPGVLVVFERDGAPLGANEGPIALVSGKDTRMGPRNVRWLSRLDVRIVKD